MAALAQDLGLDGSQTVIDVGCGTGQLAIPLARHAHVVIAIDPVAEMLTLGQQAAQATRTRNITWAARLLEQAGRAAHTPAATSRPSPPRSTGRTDRHAVIGVLDGLLDPTGSIVIINDGLSDEERPSWAQAIAQLRKDYLGDDHTAATDPYSPTRFRRLRRSETAPPRSQRTPERFFSLSTLPAV